MKFDKKDIFRILLIIGAAILSAFNTKMIVNTAGLVPGGFTGLTLILIRIIKKLTDVELPFSVFYITFNLPVFYLAFKYVGKKFTLYTVLYIILNSVLVDIFPDKAIIDDIFLSAVFGGIFSGVVGSLLMLQNASSGGTDVIAAYLFNVKHMTHAWDIILAMNVAMLAIAGLIFGWDKAMYSIIFQYTGNQVFGMVYKANQRQTMFIVTDNPSDISTLIRETTNHGATILKGEGAYQGDKKYLVYSVVSAEQSADLIKAIKAADGHSFINVIDTNTLSGKFNMKQVE